MGERHILVCDDCDDESDEHASGWRAYLTDMGQVVILCPICATREIAEN